MFTTFGRNIAMALVALVAIGVGTASAQYRTPRVSYGPVINSATPYYTGLQAQQYAAAGLAYYNSLPSYGVGYGISAYPNYAGYGYAYNPYSYSYYTGSPYYRQGGAYYTTPYAREGYTYFANPYATGTTSYYSNPFGSVGATNYVNPYTGPSSYYFVLP